MKLSAASRIRATSDFAGDLKDTFLTVIKNMGTDYANMARPEYWSSERNYRAKDFVKPYQMTKSLYSQVRGCDDLSHVQSLLEAFQKTAARDNAFALLLYVCKGEMTLEQLKKYPVANNRRT